MNHKCFGNWSDSEDVVTSQNSQIHNKVEVNDNQTSPKEAITLQESVLIQNRIVSYDSTSQSSIASSMSNNIAPSTPNKIAPSTPNNIEPSSQNSVAQSSQNSVAQLSQNSVAQSSQNSVAQLSQNSVAQLSQYSVVQSPPDFITQLPQHSIAQSPPDSSTRFKSNIRFILNPTQLYKKQKILKVVGSFGLPGATLNTIRGLLNLFFN